MEKHVFITILAGGQGARFWPISRIKRPKQFLSISASGESLLQATVRRMLPITVDKQLIVVSNVLHTDMIREHVPNAQIISEPVGRNTAASIGLAALIAKRQDPESVLIVLPADHFVRDEAKLLDSMRRAVRLASSGEHLVTLGVKPDSPNTAYGYIKRGQKLGQDEYKVARFYEKPSAQRAVKYLESGDFLWNSGMFVWRASAFLDAVKSEMPELAAGLDRIDKSLGTKEQEEVIKEVFSTLDSVSVDFGILEHVRNCAVVETGAIGWTDVGSWDAWADRFSTDDQGNLLHGDALAIDANRCVVYSKNRHIAVLGCDDLVIIDSKDALLVCPRSRVQDVRKIVDELKQRGRNDII